MNKRTPGDEDAAVVIKRPAPANRNHLLKQKTTVQKTPPLDSDAADQSAVDSKKADDVKKPLHTTEENRKHHSEQEEPSPSGTTRARRSCKDNASKAWAFLVTPSPKRARQDSHADENGGVGLVSRSPSPPKSANRSQSTRRGRASLPFNNGANASQRKRSADSSNEILIEYESPALKIPKTEEIDYSESNGFDAVVAPRVVACEMPIPTIRENANRAKSTPAPRGSPRVLPVTARATQAKESPLPKSPSKQNAVRAQATSAPRPKPTRPPPTPKSTEIKKTQPVQTPTSATTSKPAMPTPKIAPKRSQPFVEYNRIIDTLKNELNRVNEYHRSSVDDLEESYKSIIEMKDRRIKDLEKQLQSVQGTLQGTINDHLKYVNEERSIEAQRERVP